MKSIAIWVPGARAHSTYYEGGQRISRNTFGSATFARAGFNPRGKITNTSIHPLRRPYNTGYDKARIMHIITAGARLAVAAVYSDMIRYMRDKLKEDGRRLGVDMK